MIITADKFQPSFGETMLERSDDYPKGGFFLAERSETTLFPKKAARRVRL